ncbi:MAG: response regulator [Desulfohalobiaceae bacterium]|nr:response regulator [Desulfohalobiaceae bacterium]MCF8107251.1 response regulator [Desulfohalobiaceae bacterium]
MSQIKVLLVDDEKEFVNSLAERINMRELGSTVAYDGEQAMRVVQDEIPDVVVLDLRMPGIDGIEVLRRLKKSYPQVQVIVLTGHGSEKDERLARELGAYEYLQKPTRIEHLTKLIKKAYREKLEDPMVAATYAEAGDEKTARDILGKGKKKKD